MVRTLQVRFVRTAMIAITVLLLVVVCAISGINTYRTYTDVKQLADMLLDNRGIPDMGMMEPGGPGRGGMAKDSEFAADSGSDFVTDSDSEYATDPDSDYAMDPEDWDESDDADDGDDRGWFRGGRRISPDHAMSTRYFLVLFAEDGTVLKTDTSKIYSISSQKAQEMAQEVLAGGKESGLTERFLYKMKKTDDGATVVFMDVSSELSSVLSVIVISFVIAAIGWTLMLLLVIALSKKAITPIAENIVRQKQFVTNAGHELKTPLAIIMANTEALELYTGESKWTRNIKDQTKRLSGLMQNLLTLSKMDEPDLKLPKEDWDLGKLLAESAAPFEEPALSKKIRFTVDAEPVMVHANRDSMGQLLGILFDNAVKYTPEGGRISAAIRTENRQVVLEQRNSIDPKDAVEDPGRLFDRFYRSDSSRNRKKGGYGIGLSAARAIAQANGAEISAVYEDQETIVFRVKIMV